MKILNDFSVSVTKSLAEIDPNFYDLPGLVVCGTHKPHDVELMINEIEKARLEGLPFLGICFGHQLASIEHARNVLNIKDATSEEFATEGVFIVKKLPKLNVGLRDGESYWNNYEVDPEFEKNWQKSDNFITVQFHPEYQSSIDKPHPILVDFINKCKQYNAK